MKIYRTAIDWQLFIFSVEYFSFILRTWQHGQVRKKQGRRRQVSWTNAGVDLCPTAGNNRRTQLPE